VLNSRAMATSVDFKNYNQFTCQGCKTPSLCPTVTCGVSGKVIPRVVCQDCLLDANIKALNKQRSNPSRVEALVAATKASVAHDAEIYAYQKARHEQLTAEWRDVVNSRRQKAALV